MIDELQYLAEESQKVVERILDDRKEKVTEDTKYEEFVKVLEGDARLEQIDYAVIKACYDKVSSHLFSCSTGSLIRLSAKFYTVICSSCSSS